MEQSPLAPRRTPAKGARSPARNGRLAIKFTIERTRHEYPEWDVRDEAKLLRERKPNQTLLSNCSHDNRTL